MKTNLIAGGTLTALLLAGGVTGMVSAQSVAEATGLTADQAIAIALTEVPGELTEVEREYENGRQVFEIEIIDADGAEIEVEIDAETGDILTVEVDDEGKDA